MVRRNLLASRLQFFRLPLKHRQVLAGLSIIGVQFDGPAVVADGLLAPSEFGQGEREIELDVGIVWIEPGSPTIVGQGRVVLLLFGKNRAEHVMGVPIVRVNPGDFSKMPPGFLQVSPFDQRGP